MGILDDFNTFTQANLKTSPEIDKLVSDTNAASAKGMTTGQYQAEQAALPQLDMGKFLRDKMGVQSVVAQKSPNVVTVRTPDQNGELQEMDIDLRKVMTKFGGNADQWNLKVSSPDAPVEQSNLTFMDKFKLAQVDSPKDQARILMDSYGKENVRFNKDAGQFIVQKDGVWSPVHDKSWNDTMAELYGRQSGSIAGATGGAQLGATLGSIAGPIGTAAGGIIGSGVGAVIGKMATLNDAKLLGLRTEEDAGAVSKELWNDFMYSMAGEGTGKIVGAGLNKVVQKISSATTPEAKASMAKMMEHFYGTDAIDNATWLSHPEATAQVQKKVQDWEVKTLGQGDASVNPVIQEGQHVLESMFDTAKKATMGERGFYKQFMNENADAVSKTNVDMTPVYDETKKLLQQTGMIDEKGNWLTSKSSNKIQEIYGSSAVKGMRTAWDDLNKLGKTTDSEGFLTSWEDALKFKSKMNNILDSANQFGSGANITSAQQIPLIKLRGATMEAMQRGAMDVSPEFAQKSAEVMKKYSAVRSALDDVSKTMSQADRGIAIQRMFNPLKNDGAYNSVIQLSQAMGDDKLAQSTIQRLQILRAGMNTKDVSSSSGSVISKIAKSAGPTAVGAYAGYKTDGVRGALAGGALGYAAGPLFKTSSAVPIAAKTFTGLKAFAEGLSHFTSLSQSDKKLLWNTPVARDSFIQAISGAAALHSDVVQNLVQQGVQSAQDQGQ